MDEPVQKLPRPFPAWGKLAVAAVILALLFAALMLRKELERARAVREMRTPESSPTLTK